jgi:phosphoribosylformimino-5-aminoimidazole carboxamide ribotide isomerase
MRSKFILSLDLKQQSCLGHSGLERQVELWPQRVIVMSLDHVGKQQGPATELLKCLQQEVAGKDWFVAGGVRHTDDLAAIAQQAAKGVLVATALHRGQISLKTLNVFMN